MSPKKILILAGATSIIVFLLPLGLYTYIFGVNLGGEHVRWAEFGSYFSGVLAPIYAMLAFLAIIYTIYVQAHHSQDEVRRADLTRVISSIDQELDRILSESASPPGAGTEINFYLLAHEAIRQQYSSQKSGAYKTFLDTVGTPGTVLEANYRRLVARLTDLANFMGEYDAGSYGESMLSRFYSGKFSILLRMLQDARSAPENVLVFLNQNSP